MKEKIISLLLYGGLEKSEYVELKSDITRENRDNLQLYALVTMILFVLLAISGKVGNNFGTINVYCYTSAAATAALIYLLVRFAAKKYSGIVLPLMYAYILCLFAVANTLAILHPTVNSVTAIVVMLVMPLLFTERPLRMALATVAMDVVFCLVVIKVKPSEIAEVDYWNGVPFGFVAIFAGTFLMQLRIQNLYQAKEIKKLSETDLLTAIHNRNSFEKRVKLYPEQCQTSIVCIYGDVNGLHEMNNTHGHPAGDAMLKAVADSLAGRFSPDDTYRIGGDEFVSFAVDMPEDAVRKSISEADAELQKLGYHVSFGIAASERETLNMRELVRQAETEMYRVKGRYYQDTRHDRRNRTRAED